MIRRPPRSTQGVSSAASDVYKRQVSTQSTWEIEGMCVTLEDYSRNSGEIKDRYWELLNSTSDKIKSYSTQPRPVHTRRTSTFGLKKRLSQINPCLLYTSPSPRDLSTSRMPSSA
eukprot:TRINITY_DN37450_c0_g1_i1.p2 TRINITY_DN37450_c0_g1~~TRINITY_DN37450_c0_g1_i1.p2  ORF type:complete len:115 (-),score=34.90 TRINITY_DN37450_c0_g1_i1:138-482(-)